MNDLAGVKLLLCDLDGTLYQNSFEIYDGVLQTLSQLRRRMKLAFVTNTTSISWDILSKRLIAEGIAESSDEVFTPARVAQIVMQNENCADGILLCEESNREELGFFSENECGSAVLVATEGYDTTFRELNDAMRLLLNGAQLFTLQKNRFYMDEGCLVNDMGVVCAALEYAANVQARVLGKPGIDIFRAACSQAGVKISESAIVGDDIEFDVAGSMKHGIRGILVKTGKYSKEFADKTGIIPDMTLNRFADLMNV